MTALRLSSHPSPAVRIRDKPVKEVKPVRDEIAALLGVTLPKPPVKPPN